MAVYIKIMDFYTVTNCRGKMVPMLSWRWRQHIPLQRCCPSTNHMTLHYRTWQV